MPCGKSTSKWEPGMRKKNTRHQYVTTTGSAPVIKVLNGHRSETQNGHWAVVSMDNARFHGKGKACLCQIQDLVWDWPSLWDGFSRISEEQHFVPLLFHMIRVQHHLQTYLKRCKKIWNNWLLKKEESHLRYGLLPLLSVLRVSQSIAWRSEIERRKQKRKRN